MPHQILTSEKIVQAGVNIIEADKVLTFSTIAHNLGTHSQALYVYFDNQKQLSYAIVGWAVTQVIESLKTKVFSHSGKQAIIIFATELRSIALKHIQLSRFVLTVQRDDQNPEVQTAFENLRDLLHRLINSIFYDSDNRILASRCIRDLIVGDILNVGSGWFEDPTISPDDSFQESLNLCLTIIIQNENKNKNK
ncbi:TetR family transcriptional regulator [Oenococcus oeni]|uniref:TetR/AcrR family transcriptional regulator n=1 Tax=Oenococcus oeni TaxID=1247 RepID=UPI000BDF87B8|nr:TetR/AcrR family transcriptional regulator [Oenococcus oeni]PDH94433.1 TetR family transcriptional regulator [Oenococcus oeni]